MLHHKSVFQDSSPPPLYEPTVPDHLVGKEDGVQEDLEETGPPPEPTRFGWVQGVMVGGGGVSVSVSLSLSRSLS